MNKKKVLPVNIFALICSLWFFFTGWMWVYFMNLIFSFPIGLLGYFLWKKGKKKDPESILNKTVLGFLIGGVFVSLLSLFIFK